MLQELVGIVEDGTVPGALWLPPNARATVSTPFATTLTLLIKCYLRSGVGVPAAATGTVLTLAISGNPEWSPWITKVATAAPKYGDNAWTVDLGAEWRQIPCPGTYVYDVWLAQTSPTRENAVIPTSPFVALTGVQRPH